VLSYSGSGIETTFTQGEDACLAALVPALPAAAEDDPPNLLVVGVLADVVEDQMRRLFGEMGLERVSFLPGRSSEAMPSIGPSTRFILAQPFLGETARLLEARGAQKVVSLFPLGAEGTSAWLRAAALALGVPAARTEAALALPERRARAAVARHRSRLAGRRIMMFPDSQLEVPLARFLTRELGMEVTEIGTPYLHRQHLQPELDCLGSAVIVEGADVDRQLDRCRRDPPDLVVCGLGLANPLEAEGIATKWSIELLFTPIQGYEQAGDLAELFARPLVRRDRLEV
jgi:light-independent protochlorophyllide reductase subunit N